MNKITASNADNSLPPISEGGKRLRQLKLLIPAIIDEVLGPSEYGEYDLLPLICISKALNNIGVKSKTLSLSPKLITPKGAYYLTISAISVDKIVYGGEGRVGWDCLIELQREKIKGREQDMENDKSNYDETEELINLVIPNHVATHQDDYISKGKPTHITLEDFAALNIPNNLITEEEIQMEMGRYQSMIDEFILNALTKQPVVKLKKRMRL